MSATNCPSREELFGFLVGTLSEDAAERVVEHVSSCPSCQATLETIDEADDTLMARLKRPPDRDPYAEEPQRQGLLTHAKALAVGPSLPGKGSTDLATGDSTVLGEYQLLEKLGEGGMGAVYRARHTKLKRVVALKVLPQTRMTDDRAIARFEREMEAVGQLDHPNIVRALDAREVDGMHLLVMELVEGMDLSELVHRLGPLPIADACELVRQAAVGLAYAHEQGLIHRDVKPSNLMLTESSASSDSQGEERRATVKILDLGLALLHGPQSEAADELTGSEQMMGTLDYMAPEQGTDSHGVDVRADVYSLGATLYKLLSGHSPFSGKEYNTPVKKMLALATEPVPPIRERRADVPDELAAVLDRMLARDPDDRFATPADAAAALEPLTTGCDLPGLLAKAEAQTGSATGPEKLLAATDELASSALVGTEPSRPRAPSRQPVPTRRRWKPLAIAVALLVLLIGGPLAFQIIIRIRDKEGRETVVQVPEGAEVTIEKDGELVVTAPGADKSKEPEPSALGKPKLTPIEIEPEARQWEPGDPLSAMALVTEPASVPGVQSWTIETREHRGAINAVAHSPDGRLLATAGDDGTVRIRDASSANLLRILHGHDGTVAAVAWSPNSRYVASAGHDNTVRLWNATNGQQLRVLRGHEGSVRAVAWSPDGNYLLSGGSDKTLTIWEAGSGKPCISFPMEAAG